MRKTTKLAILLAVLAALCLTVFLLSRRQARQEAVRESGETILAIDPESVTSLAWTNESGSFAFRREGDGWVYEGDEAFPVDGEKLTTLLEPLEELGAAKTESGQGTIYTLSIIGQIEGHMILPETTKTTKY